MYRQRSYALQQLIVALIASAILTILLRWAGLNAMTAVLFIVLTIVFFYASAIFLTMLRMRRPRMRPFGNGGGGRGDWSGEREPRSPYPPHWPPRAEAATPEDTEQQPFSRRAGYDYPQPSQPFHPDNYTV
jgi:hypothetical protein